MQEKFEKVVLFQKKGQGIIELFDVNYYHKSGPAQDFSDHPNLFWTCRRTEHYLIKAPL